MVWFGLVWFGLAWFGLVWFGLVWFGVQMIKLRVISAILYDLKSLALVDTRNILLKRFKLKMITYVKK